MRSRPRSPSCTESTQRILEAISQMALLQEHENTKTRDNLKGFFFVLSWFRGFVIVRVYETRSKGHKRRTKMRLVRPRTFVSFVSFVFNRRLRSRGRRERERSASQTPARTPRRAWRRRACDAVEAGPAAARRARRAGRNRARRSARPSAAPADRPRARAQSR